MCPAHPMGKGWECLPSRLGANWKERRNVGAMILPVGDHEYLPRARQLTILRFYRFVTTSNELHEHTYTHMHTRVHTCSLRAQEKA